MQRGEQMSRSSGSSGISTTSTTSTTCSSGDRLRHMKAFIAAYRAYNVNRLDDSAAVMNRSLQVLRVSIDLSIFDPTTNAAAEFFGSLHLLMGGLDAHSTLLWSAVDVLQLASRNKAARRALTNTFNFLPHLTKVLSDSLTMVKKRLLLLLMQELTYGIKISWQWSHLPHLIRTLVDWIQRREEALLPLCLGVLLNLCDKNLPAIFVLLRLVDSKTMIRSLSTVHNPATEMHVCKLVMILEQVHGDMTSEQLVKYVGCAVRAVETAAQARDALQLRYAVEFFADIRRDKAKMEAVRRCDDHLMAGMQNALAVVETYNATSASAGDGEWRDTESKCIALVLQLFQFCLELGGGGGKGGLWGCSASLHGRLCSLALRWVPVEEASAEALALLRIIVLAAVKGAPSAPPTPSSDEMETDVTQDRSETKVLDQLNGSLPVLLLGLDGYDATAEPRCDHLAKMGSLLQLLRCLAETGDAATLKKIVHGLRLDTLRTIFRAMLMLPAATVTATTPTTTTASNNNIDAKPTDVAAANGHGDALSADTVNFYVQALALVWALSQHSDQWSRMAKQLLEERQVHNVLAQALYLGQADVKSLVLGMTPRPEFPFDKVSAAMAELQPLMLLTSDAANASATSGSFQPNLDDLCSQLVHGRRMEQLNSLIAKIEKLNENGQIQNVATSDIMELYEYKVAGMGHNERAALANLEAADKHATHLQHKLARLTSEVSRLHQMLHASQHMYEERAQEVQQARDQLQQMEQVVEHEENKREQQAQEAQRLEGELAEARSEAARLRGQLQALSEQHARLGAEHAGLAEEQQRTTGRNAELKASLEKMSESYRRLEAVHQETREQAAGVTRRAEALEEQLAARADQVQQLEAAWAELDGERAAILRELQDKKRIIETITDLAKASA